MLIDLTALTMNVISTFRALSFENLQSLFTRDLIDDSIVYFESNQF